MEQAPDIRTVVAEDMQPLQEIMLDYNNSSVPKLLIPTAIGSDHPLHHNMLLPELLMDGCSFVSPL